jgi:broad specificity phosphatase PhoE
MADPAAAPHGGESFETAQARAAAWLESLHGTGGHRLAVTHPVILKLLFAHVLGAPLSSVWRIDAEPFCLLSLSSEGTRWALRGFGPAIR